MTTKGSLGTAVRFGYTGGSGAQPPVGSAASKWRRSTMTWGSMPGADPETTAKQAPVPTRILGQFGFGYRGHSGDPRDGAKVGRLAMSVGNDLFAGIGWSWNYDAGVRLSEATPGRGELQGTPDDNFQKVQQDSSAGNGSEAVTLVSYRFCCGSGHEFIESDSIGEYGEFVMRGLSSPEAYLLRAIEDPVYSDVDLVLQNVLGLDDEAERAGVLKEVFGAACDPADDGSLLKIGRHPCCPVCGSRRMFSWEPAGPFLGVCKVVSHEGWNSLGLAERLKILRMAVQSVQSVQSAEEALDSFVLPRRHRLGALVADAEPEEREAEEPRDEGRALIGPGNFRPAIKLDRIE